MKHRIEQLSEEIARLANESLVAHAEIPSGMLVTVVGSELSKDLREAVIRVSVLPEHRQGTGLEVVRKLVPVLRSAIAKSLSMKHVPVLSVRLADKEWYLEQQRLHSDNILSDAEAAMV